MSTQRVIFGAQSLVVLGLPFVVVTVNPADPGLWLLAVGVIGLLFAGIAGRRSWVVAAAVVVSCIVLSAEAPTRLIALVIAGTMSAAALVTSVAYDGGRTKRMATERKPMAWVLSILVIVAGLAVTTLALTSQVKQDNIFSEAQQQAANLFSAAPQTPIGVDDGTSPILAADESVNEAPGDLIASLTFKTAEGTPTVTTKPVYVRDGVDDRTLALGPGRYDGSVMPGEIGNLAIAGHRTGYGSPFLNLDQLKPGDTVVAIGTDGESYPYTVVSEQIVDPDSPWVLGKDPLGLGKPMLTLTTCDPPDTSDKRLVVFAALA